MLILAVMLKSIFLGISTVGCLVAGNHVGDKVIVADKVAVCGSTPAALDEVTKWLVRSDKEEAARALLHSGSTLIQEGAYIKILDLGIMRSKIRIIKTDKECWVATEVTQRAH
jgi:hypothetical protein